ncbi:putative rRNA methyltransferase [Nocardia nova SH22a]|uniref:Putative rRNA methyltransferase n=1 Tax=Nocardia nova SH22a TaxID=1415166 RepID=W5TWZ5_9NOCA|nr:23S ribosomal RNA methyltransferase Erm [Nocardia nova]AHH21731.1 putative rRNA methyltransferase [Nocardia nova SH22a]
MSRFETRKTLSQNFLTDPRIARMIVRTSGITPADLVLEVGPGAGMLTRQLLTVSRRVRTYEKDPHYADRLRRRYAGDYRIRCHHSDFRDVIAPREPFAVVANVPFAITTDIVRWCLAARHLRSATLLTQWEFARKHSGDYGRWSKLSITQWPWTESALGPRVSRDAFRPRPAIDGGVLILRRRPEPLLPKAYRADYRNLVELGFSGVGGSFAASLRRAHPAARVHAACAAAGISRELTVGLVPPEAWIRVFDHLIVRAGRRARTDPRPPPRRPALGSVPWRRQSRFGPRWTSNRARSRPCSTGSRSGTT